MIEVVKMRLVDAEALYNGAMKDEYFDFDEHDNHGRESFAYSCAMQRLAEAPTIDAIPVEWMQNVRNDERLTLNDVETIDLILTWWRKEQEVKHE